jgi:hypothetical protein
MIFLTPKASSTSLKEVLRNNFFVGMAAKENLLIVARSGMEILQDIFHKEIAPRRNADIQGICGVLIDFCRYAPSDIHILYPAYDQNPKGRPAKVTI